MLANDDIDRYSRQILLPEIGGRGQQQLLQSVITVSGGEAAAFAMLYLQAAGVGRIETALTRDASMDLPIAPSEVAAFDAATGWRNNQVALIEAGPGTPEDVQQRCQVGLWTVYVMVESNGGRLRTFGPGETPQLPPFTPSGPAAVVTPILGSLAATEVMRLLLGLPATLQGNWLIFDAEGSTLTYANA